MARWTKFYSERGKRPIPEACEFWYAARTAGQYQLTFRKPESESIGRLAFDKAEARRIVEDLTKLLDRAEAQGL